MAAVKSGVCRHLIVAWLASACLLPAGRGLAADASTAPRFAGVFGSGMVLPHDEVVTLRGQAAPGERLTLQVGDRTHHLRADAEGRWRQQIGPLRAGGPYTLTLRDDRGAGATLDNVLAGEVWLCSGQSNMEFQVGMSDDQPAEVLDGHPAIRLLAIAHQTALSARDTFADAPAWQTADTGTVRRFSALCYFFARRRIEERGLPIGLVNASWGGSAIEAWIGEPRLARLPAHRRGVELLRRYRADPRASELAFAEDWMKWWHASSKLGPVWERGVLDGHADWQPAPLTDWRSYPDPRLQSFTGNLWFSARVDLTEAQSRQGASFVLGKIDEVDTTWLNGRFVANSFGYGTRREYRLEPGMLVPGTNQFSVLVTNTYGAGGMTGPESDVGIRFDDGTFIALGDAWKYRIVPRETGYPPRAPWESVAGVSGMFNGMIAPLMPLRPNGVIWYQGESNADRAGGYGELLQALITDWRVHFGRPDLPFIVVQLPNYGTVATAPAESGWATLRHMQQQVALGDERVGLVVTQDLGKDADIHPRAKYAVAQRALAVARALEGSGVADGIVPQVTAAADRAWTLEFLPPLAAEPARRIGSFTLCTADLSRCEPAAATQQGSRIEIDRSALPLATRLRYCWSDGGTCPLRSLNGLPVGSFELPLPP